MASVAYPLYTEQPYGFTEGKVLLANRVYVGPVATAKPTTKIAGITPASPVGWVDLGSIDGSVVTIEKAAPDIIPVETGLFEVLRGEVPRKDGEGTAKWTMVEYEPAAWAALTGDVMVDVGLGTDNAIFVGGRPIIQKALLLVGQTPVTQAEFHHWSPKVNITYMPVIVNQFQGISVTAKFLKFNDAADVADLGRDFQIIYWE